MSASAKIIYISVCIIRNNCDIVMSCVEVYAFPLWFMSGNSHQSKRRCVWMKNMEYDDDLASVFMCLI